MVAGDRTAAGDFRSRRTTATAPRSPITKDLRKFLWCQTLPQSTDSRGPRFQGGFGYLRIIHAVGAMANGLLHNELGRGTRRNEQFSFQMDARRREDTAPCVLGGRSLQCTKGDAIDSNTVTCHHSVCILRLELARVDLYAHLRGFDPLTYDDSTNTNSSFKTRALRDTAHQCSGLSSHAGSVREPTQCRAYCFR